MKKSLSVFSVALVALMITSCGSSEKASEQSQQTAQAPAPSPAPNAAEATKPKAQASTSRSSVSGLIPSTDPKQRRQKIEQGRKDPFAFVPVNPQQKMQPVPPQPPSNAPQPNPSSPVPPSVSSPSRPRPSQPALPPQPELAKAVAIAGIIDIGGVTQIIVKAPGERTSRYVQPGDYLANGQVLVKRVENPQSPTPVVVLEELGQEVYKEVGEGVANQPSQTKPDQEQTAFTREVFPGGS